ncbi:TetR/AcrR family transcriptional regulator, partial [Acinetobacter baumannii]|uniref:TetR/AcrR family transcriptional regulator n=1 Tax=Acinetobacter baumannii TaxID=470 RepID=UPI001AECD9D4
RDLFLEREFDQVTMSQIAKKADVGLGTAYNYYSSKEELFLIAGGTAFIFGEEIDVTIIKNVSTLISTLVNELAKLAQIERTVWRTSLSSLTKAAEKKPELFLDLVEIDHEFINQIKDILIEFQINQMIKNKTESDVLLEVLYSIMFTSFLSFI